MSLTLSSIGEIKTETKEQTDGFHQTITYQFAFTGTYSDVALLTTTTFTAGTTTYTIPAWNSEHPVITNSIVTQRTPYLDPDSDDVGTTATPGTCYLEVQYDPKPAGGWTENPIGKVDVRGGGTDELIYKKTDKDGNACNNSAGDLYSDIPGQPIQGSKYEITIYYASNPDSLAKQYSNTVNSDSWHGREAGTVRIGVVNWTKQQINGVYCYPTTFPMSERRDGFRWKEIDNGFRPIPDGGTAPKHKCDEAGNPVQVPVLLNGSGKELASGADPVVYPADGFKMLDEASFSGLGLPDPSTF